MARPPAQNECLILWSDSMTLESDQSKRAFKPYAIRCALSKCIDVVLIGLVLNAVPVRAADAAYKVKVTVDWSRTIAVSRTTATFHQALKPLLGNKSPIRE